MEYIPHISWGTESTILCILKPYILRSLQLKGRKCSIVQRWILKIQQISQLELLLFFKLFQTFQNQKHTHTKSQCLTAYQNIPKIRYVSALSAYCFVLWWSFQKLFTCYSKMKCAFEDEDSLHCKKGILNFKINKGQYEECVCTHSIHILQPRRLIKTMLSSVSIFFVLYVPVCSSCFVFKTTHAQDFQHPYSNVLCHPPPPRKQCLLCS